MNIELTTFNRTQETTSQKQQVPSKENDGKFAEELKNIKKDSDVKNEIEIKNEEEVKKDIEVKNDIEVENNEDIKFKNEIKNEKEIKNDIEVKNDKEAENNEDIKFKNETENKEEVKNGIEVKNDIEVENNEDIKFKNETENKEEVKNGIEVKNDIEVENNEDIKFKNEIENEKEIKKDIEVKNDIEVENSKDIKYENEIKYNKEIETLNKTDPQIYAVADEKENKSFDKALHGLKTAVKEVNQSDDKRVNALKKDLTLSDNKKEGEILINNDFNIQENKDIMPQMNPNMNFGSDEQPFSSFMNNKNDQSNDKLSSSAKDLAEEAAILSTMAENIAIANRVKAEEPDVKIVNKNDGIKKINTHTGITQETIVKYDSVIMNQADVEVFANLVQNKELNLNEINSESVQKSIKVSKTLSDLLAKAMQDNKPLRIDFDNNISVIIKISRDGKLTADFLPSSQVAEAYLKANLPLLKQRFDEQNIDYESLNQRERRNKEQNNNRKKGSDNE